MSARDCGCGIQTLAAYAFGDGWDRHSRFSSLVKRENVSLCDIHQVAAIDNKNPNSDGVGTLLATELGLCILSRFKCPLREVEFRQQFGM